MRYSAFPAVLLLSACSPAAPSPEPTPTASPAPPPREQAPSVTRMEWTPVPSDQTGPGGAPAPQPGHTPTPAPTPVPTRTPTPTLPPSSDNPFSAILDQHNRLRAAHCAGELRWSAEVAAVAQEWADHLAASQCSFGHRPQNRFGENLSFHGPPSSRTSRDVAQAWYDEERLYDYQSGSFSMDTGHFTQLVWRATTHLGCGVSRCGGGEIWVCNYHPAGNVMGSFQSQVLAPSCK